MLPINIVLSLRSPKMENGLFFKCFFFYSVKMKQISHFNQYNIYFFRSFKDECVDCWLKQFLQLFVKLHFEVKRRETVLSLILLCVAFCSSSVISLCSLLSFFSCFCSCSCLYCSMISLLLMCVDCASSGVHVPWHDLLKLFSWLFSMVLLVFFSLFLLLCRCHRCLSCNTAKKVSTAENVS